MQERHIKSLRRRLAEAETSLRLIHERMSQYILETDIPLQYIREKERLEQEIIALQARLESLQPSPPPPTEPLSEPGRGSSRTAIPWWRSRKVWVPITVALVGLAGVIIPTILTRCNGNGDSEYLVRVEAKGTGNYVERARVTIEIGGKAPLDDVTDTHGLAIIRIPPSYAKQPGRLIVEASGYKKYEQNISLVLDALPDVIQLEPTSIPTSTHTPTPTSTPTPTATFTPTPTPTPTLTITSKLTPTRTLTLTSTDMTVPAAVVSPTPCVLEGTPGGDLKAPSVCVACVSVQINEGTPEPVGWDEHMTLTAGDALRLVNLRYCTSGEALADNVAGEAYLFPNGVETYEYGLFTRRGVHIRTGCGNVGDFEGSWIMEPGQHRVVIALMHYFSEPLTITVPLPTRCTDKRDCEVDDRFYINLDVP